ncbi:hypothetical protein I350_05724 [Cryptococcus amylolentus CBS 6273]|uniref:Uncharacterized protein n=1 Tax=Cryptococcus amylolentus CBS 6273 TaxID=1296118 RepID=A0A1E3JPZ9_9TREE|nr:hypothetical protein I350_05724 [Cryptococcus amylolentus CBS 6273]
MSIHIEATKASTDIPQQEQQDTPVSVFEYQAQALADDSSLLEDDAPSCPTCDILLPQEAVAAAEPADSSHAQNTPPHSPSPSEADSVSERDNEQSAETLSDLVDNIAAAEEADDACKKRKQDNEDEGGRAPSETNQEPASGPVNAPPVALPTCNECRLARRRCRLPEGSSSQDNACERCVMIDRLLHRTTIQGDYGPSPGHNNITLLESSLASRSIVCLLAWPRYLHDSVPIHEELGHGRHPSLDHLSFTFSALRHRSPHS